ncbi:carbohydrate kinase family protein [bacterium]|nr:carbohydrate kinase family protein [bacterium]
MVEVWCVGILVADVIAKPVGKFPERGKLELVEEMELHAGGCALNTGLALAKLGVRVGVIGKVGNDGFGDFLIKQLQQGGVISTGIRRDQTTKTSATMVLVDEEGERSFVHYLGANAKFTLNDIDFDLLKEGKIFHVAGAFLLSGFDGGPMAQALRQAKQLGLITSLDTAWDSQGRWLRLIEPVLPHIDVFIPSFEEAKRISGKQTPEKVADFFLDYGIKIVALKMGEEGAFVKNRQEAYQIPVYPVPVVDATGAGDAFVAGFLFGMLRDWDLKTIGQFANAVGACCVTTMGATAGIKSMQETLQMIK